MEDDELLDSELLEQTVLDLIKQGKRNFSIDLSGLDYIYSDSMNKLLGLNRKVLDVNGRLSLLSPTDEVRQIIERAGIHNFIKIFDDEQELA
ncbi:MAG: STAS domain-containing protein, partial [Chitinivibrionales bacterium]|nr:STAS domain-containing protein [Chitinivibrionales bacterium]MBD3356145.1 STAS domain-containing protein [Chitinivibrionales bacterium]